MNTRRALISNFSGIGNGIIILPILKCLDESRSGIKYFHISNPILHCKDFLGAISLDGLLGLVPPSWRRFGKEDWSNIQEFVVVNGIDLIINTRNEGPQYDQEYFRFKEFLQGNVEFWDLDHSMIESRNVHQLLALDILSMLQKRGIDITNHRPQWLQPSFINNAYEPSHRSTSRVGFYTGASQPDKRWSAGDWQMLGASLLERFDCIIEIYSGKEQAEEQLAQKVAEHLLGMSSTARCRVVSNLSVFELAQSISRLSFLVSNDTFAVHLAAAIDIPTIGLYFTTNASIWGGHSEHFTPVQSEIGLNCSLMKYASGNCKNYYLGCPEWCNNKSDVTPSRVWQMIEENNCFGLTLS